MAAVEQTAPLKLVLRAFRRRCPHCGSGGLFSGWFTIVERCPLCGLKSERIEGHFVGAVGISTIVTFAAIGAFLVTGFIVTHPDIAVWPLTIGALALAIGIPIIFWPVSRTLWTAIDIMMRPVEQGEVDPRYDADTGSGYGSQSK